jgi:hypothetical protein
MPVLTGALVLISVANMFVITAVRAQQPAPDQGAPIDYDPLLTSYLLLARGLVHQFNGATNWMMSYGASGLVTLTPLLLIEGLLCVLALSLRTSETHTAPQTRGCGEKSMDLLGSPEVVPGAS